MAELSKELIAKLKKAKNIEEVAALLKAYGQDEALAEEIWKEIEDFLEKEGKELSLDELEAVAGGRDWVEKGCAATVEPDSDCWRTDGGCFACNIDYTNAPCKQKCLYCGAKWTGYRVLGHFPDKLYLCRECGKHFYITTAIGAEGTPVEWYWD